MANCFSSTSTTRYGSHRRSPVRTKRILTESLAARTGDLFVLPVHHSPKGQVPGHCQPVQQCACVSHQLSKRTLPLPSSVATEMPGAIQASDYGFLDHDSFIDCGNVYRLYQSDIEDEIRAEPTTIKGELHASTKQEILQVVQEATTISKRDKNLIVAGLS